nr:nuclear pore complex protein Nup93-like [Onthophagus taurus]
MSDFSDLLFEAEKLTQEIEDASELPKVDRSLRQVLEASNELYNRVAQTGAKDIQANLLLGSKGIDLPRIAQKLDLISSKRTFEAVQPVDDVDITACLENETRNCILSVINDEHKKCFNTISEQAWEHQMGEWKQEKLKILNAMIGPSGNFITLPKQRTLFMEPVVVSSLLDKEEAMYAAKIMEYNMALMREGRKPNPVSLFAKAAEEFKNTKVNDMWEIVRYMVEMPAFPKESDPVASRNTDAVVLMLASQGRRYLEYRYKTYMNNIINENLLRAQRGGIPGTYPLVKSFVGVRFQGDYLGLQDGYIEERPFWPVVYYCLRAGDLSATLHCLKKSTVECQDLIGLLEMRLSKGPTNEIEKLENNIRFQYRRFVRNATDPFKRIVWSVLGCCDVSDEHSEVAKTADDYLWLKLSLVRAGYDREDHIDYNDLQRTIIDDYGEAHYDALNQPHLYFQVLMLTGQFEAAIEFLARIERYKVHAVHMAIALNEIYLLAGPSDYSSPLLFIDPADPKPSRRINIVRLIMVYVRKFEVTAIEEALHYFYLLNRVKNQDDKNMYMVCVSDLVQETREFERMFGKIQPNGIRTKGLLDQFPNCEATPEIIADYVAGELVHKGLFEDAVDMYDIANNQVEVLTILCTLLSQVVHLQTQEGSIRERIQGKIKDVFERYASDGFKCPANIAASFTTLKDLMLFFDFYHSKQFNQAIKLLNELQLVPLQANELNERVNSFKRLNVSVCKVLPDVLLATMNILYDQYQKLKSTELLPQRRIDSNIDKQLSYLREQAKVITNFTGMLPYRMPGDTNSRLVQMEILMH